MLKGKIMMIVCLGSVMYSLMDTSMAYAKKWKPPVEKVYTWDDTMWVTRKKFGLIAKDVNSVKLGGWHSNWNVFITRKGKNIVQEVNLFNKKRKGRINYKLNIVSHTVKGYYPMLERIVTLDKKNRLLVTGYDNCYTFENHTSEKECKARQNKRVVNKIVQRDINVKRCWHDSDMFAYVKNNTLYVTGMVAQPYVPSLEEELECYQYDTVRQFFQGKADNIRDVVCGEDNGVYGNNIFVLMNDGSVWGMGNNREKLISNNKKKYYEDFVQIISKGVKKIAASAENVAVIKENNALYVWGHTMKSSSSKKYKNSATPRKIAKNVKDVAVSGYCDTTLIYLKKNGVAYGMGMNRGYALTDKYKSGWHSKPVKLMKNVKQVCSACKATFLLKKNKELYWTGTDECSPNFGWVAKKLSKK